MNKFINVIIISSSSSLFPRMHGLDGFHTRESSTWLIVLHVYIWSGCFTAWWPFWCQWYTILKARSLHIYLICTNVLFTAKFVRSCFCIVLWFQIILLFVSQRNSKKKESQTSSSRVYLRDENTRQQLVSVDFSTLVALPKSVERNEWMAMHSKWELSLLHWSMYCQTVLCYFLKYSLTIVDVCVVLTETSILHCDWCLGFNICKKKLNMFV